MGMERWEILRRGHIPYELAAGEHYSKDGYLLTGGLRAASPGEAVDGEKLPR
jgi:hypothetical protein